MATIYKCVRVRTYIPRTHHSLISSARDILEYLELGTQFFDAVKSLSELSSASIRIQENPKQCQFQNFVVFANPPNIIAGLYLWHDVQPGIDRDPGFNPVSRDPEPFYPDPDPSRFEFKIPDFSGFYKNFQFTFYILYI